MLPLRDLTRFGFPVLLALLLGSCATERGLIPPPLQLPKDAAPAPYKLPPESVQNPSTRVSVDTPKPPVPAISSTVREADRPAQPGDEKADITLMFDQLQLPNFIQVVFGNILKANFSVDEKVSSRTDLVTLRTAKPQTPAQVRLTATLLLKTYGIAVTDVGGFLRIVPDNTMQGYSPEIRRGRALPTTPLPLRPIFQLVELVAVQTNEVTAWINKMYGQKLNIQEDSARGLLLISGQSDDVAAAMESIRVLDQPRMRGQHSARIDPLFWSALDLGNKLNEILSAEGYRTSPSVSANTPVIILPIPTINSIFVFAGDPAIVSHVVDWARDLDKPTRKGGGLFTYKVRYSDAQELAKTVRELLGTAPAAPAQPQAAGQGQPARTRVVVNPSTNTLIFQGTMDEYSGLVNLLQDLDQPAKTALIEVTVAEVNLTGGEQLGIEWTLNNANAAGAIWSVGTLGGLGIGAGGLNIRRFSLAGDPRVLINALATKNRARILSSPRILARNGETATIQVGQEVPVITSQQTTPVTGGTGGVLQTVQYRQTGVILKVKPVIHAGDRIELEVAQEVSSAGSTTTGVSTSPTISTRKVETKLSLKDGATVLLGGLMSGNQSNNQSGVPFLKDIPGVGQLFRVDADTYSSTELIVLITPYIISDDKDAAAITEAFRERLGGWAQNAPPARAYKHETNPQGPSEPEQNGSGENQALPSKPTASLPNRGAGAPAPGSAQVPAVKP